MSLTLYRRAGIAGVPLFAGGCSGWSSAAFGYVLGRVVAGVGCGALAWRAGDRTVLTAFASLVLGSAAIYTVGVAWLGLVIGAAGSQLLAVGVMTFLLVDAIKATLAAGLLPAPRRLVDRSERL